MPSTPPPTPNADLVRDRLRARARRISVIRRRVVAAALATFAIAFGTIAASGSLGSTAATDSTQTGSGQSDTATTASATSSDNSSSSGTTSSSSDDSSSSSGSTSSGSTSQRLDLERIHVERLVDFVEPDLVVEPELWLGRHDEPVLGAAAMLAATVNDHLFWITSRAAGTLALLFSSVAVGVGLLMGAQAAQGPRARPARHPRGAVAGDASSRSWSTRSSLLGDSFLHPSLADITIPFVSRYMTAWTTVGIVGGWMMIILGLSFYARGAHRPAALAQAAPLHRARLAPRPRPLARRGHRRRQAWFLVATGIVALPAAALLVVRMSPRRPAPRAVAPEAVAR